ncbi:hypothetical protein PG994_000701 [Apiospora phragmitis]|uniref:Uncharacterized protein n=1 Tax=Apiospora phragmitis TaxID=2905665 RepID=A0ABR1X710_9PEZI
MDSESDEESWASCHEYPSDSESGSSPGSEEDTNHHSEQKETNIEHQFEQKVTELKYLKRDRQETSKDRNILETKLANSKAGHAEQEIAIRKHEELLESAKRESNRYLGDAEATEKTISDIDAKANTQTQKIDTLEEEIDGLRTRLPPGSQDPQPRTSVLKRGSDDFHDYARKRLRTQQREQDVELAEAEFHTKEGWTRARFDKKTGIAYAPVSEEAREMAAKVIVTLEQQVFPMPLQIRQVFQDTPQRMRDRNNTESIVKDKPYHTFFDYLAEGIRALQKSVDVMVTQLIHLRHSFNSGAEANPANVRELLDSFEKAYSWYELQDLIGFDLEDEYDEVTDQARLSLSRALSQGSNVSPDIERLISKLLENMSRFAFWATLLGGCLVEGYGRGDFEDDDDDHGISGPGISDLARIVERYHDLEKSPSTGLIFMPGFIRSDGLKAGYSLRPLHSTELAGVPEKVLGKLIAHVQHIEVNIWNFLRGWPLKQNLWITEGQSYQPFLYWKPLRRRLDHQLRW